MKRATKVKESKRMNSNKANIEINTRSNNPLNRILNIKSNIETNIELNNNAKVKSSKKSNNEANRKSIGKIHTTILGLNTNRNRVITYGILVVIWMVVIFCYSSQNAEKSTESSSELTHAILNILTQTGFISACNISLQEFTKVESLIRTMAHFTEYLIFSLFTFQLSRYSIANINIKKILYPFLFCSSYAITDEIHQYFVPGRAMQLEDWFVDSMGILCGVLIMLFLTKSKNKKQK